MVKPIKLFVSLQMFYLNCTSDAPHSLVLDTHTLVLHSHAAPSRKDQAVLDLAVTGESGGFGTQKRNACLTSPVVK